MKPDLLSLLQCPECTNALVDHGEKGLVCQNCGHQVKMLDGKPLFTEVPQTIEPWQKVERGPDKGTPWRQSNWKFLKEVVSESPSGDSILDVGAGHGDFADIFIGRNYYSLDIVPYPEVDLVADLGQVNPFKPNSFDLIVLMNVLEHVYESRDLLKSLSGILKPGGRIAISVPFLLKVHQAPFDFARYTPYALEKMAYFAGMKVQSIKGYYDTLFLINESLGNAWRFSLNQNPKPRRYFAKALVFVIQKLVNWLGHFLQKGFSSPYQKELNPAPFGYLVVLEK
jgi:SAM-dependent methyltransferase